MGNSNKTNNKKWPNFLILGAAKAGTTAVYNYLRQHPEVYMPDRKEPAFFAMYGETLTLPQVDKNSAEYRASEELYQKVLQHSVVDPEEYLELFAGVDMEKAVGEASTSSLYFPRAAENIQDFVPDARLIVILRNPVERAFSAFLHLVRTGREQRTFKEAIAREPIDSENIWWGNGEYYVRPGFYSKQLNRYYSRFGRDQIRVYLYDDLIKDTRRLMEDLFGFIGVDVEFQPDTSRKHNVSAVAGNMSSGVFNAMHRLATSTSLLKALANLIKEFMPSRWRKGLVKTHRSVRLHKHLTQSGSMSSIGWVGNEEEKFLKPEIDPEVKQQLMEIYRNDIIELQELLCRDLSHWLQDTSSDIKTA